MGEGVGLGVGLGEGVGPGLGLTPGEGETPGEGQGGWEASRVHLDLPVASVMHVQPGSTRHVDEQPSPSDRSPSSHCSEPSTTALPQLLSQRVTCMKECGHRSGAGVVREQVAFRRRVGPAV